MNECSGFRVVVDLLRLGPEELRDGEISSVPRVSLSVSSAVYKYYGG
jgi:hypothetical protein